MSSYCNVKLPALLLVIMGFRGHPGCWRRSPKVGVFPEKEILPANYQIKGEWIGL